MRQPTGVAPPLVGAAAGGTAGEAAPRLLPVGEAATSRGEMPQGVAPREEATRQAVPQEAAAQEEVHENAAPQEAAPLEGALQDAATQEAASQEEAPRNEVPFEPHADPGTVDSDSDDDDAIDRYRPLEDTRDPRAPSVKKLRTNANFQEWVRRSQRSTVRPELQSVDRVSAAKLILKNEEKRIIATPREYQLELFERAKEKNLIIVLDTGSGKTLIAALLLRHTLENELERRATGGSSRVAFFLVDKVALCFQQYSVLRANLEHPVAKFHGEVAGMMRTKEFWDQQLAANMVFVCTAQVLLDCLNNGFLQVSQVNLLIFDEAHHTKKNHPYARIIKDHYLREPHATRPRIFGMTASPVDAQTRDLRAAASGLETMLCSEIATVSDEALIESHARRQQVEIKEYYDRLPYPEDAQTPLWDQIDSLISDDAAYRVHLDSSQEAASTLGSWCADRYWELLVDEAEVAKRTAKAHVAGEADRVEATMKRVLKMIRENATSRAASQPPAGFSSKFKALRQSLEDAFCRQGTQRCIVFVQKRYTAFLLADAFQHTDQKVPGMNASYLVGSQTVSSGFVNMSFRDQVVALQRFRRGETNCLFTTQVAEEGIDIPECDLIIRFDLYDSAIQYIQSKGRARQARSTYISMLEQGNMHHLRRLKQATRDATALRRFCSALPADRKIQDSVDMDSLLENERVAQKVYEIKETGARLTFVSSLEVLAKFVASLGDASATPEYVVTYSHLKRKFVATVLLPESSPIKSKSGSPQRNKQLAKGSAAFEACVELVQMKLINSHLQPTLSKRLPAMRNARLALSPFKQEKYVMRIKPEAWAQLGPPTELFKAVLSLDNPSATGRPTSPMMILTRFPLPPLEPTMLYLDRDHRSLARLVPLPETPLKLSPDQAEALTQFTLAIFTDVFSKQFSAEAAEMPYFFAPVADDDSASVDWGMLTALAEAEPPSWRGASDDFFENKLIMDPWDGSRKFITHGVNRSLRPSDPVPAGAPEPKSRAYKQTDGSIKEYSNSLAINSRRRQNWTEDQPVVNAELLPLRRNFLDQTASSGEEPQAVRCWLILEPLRISKLPIGIASMALFVPVMMFRLDSVLVALEACKMLDLESIRPSLALEALTKDSFNTEEHDQEQINFQVGMGPNYERLELLGDAFLKMSTSISLFTLIPGSDEFAYHVDRMMLVCNRNLFNHAVDRKLHEYVRSRTFDRRTWYPNLRLEKGKVPKTEVWHSLSDKSIADVCEAVIGAAYLSGGGDNDMDLAVRAVTKMVRSKYHKMLKFSDYHEAFKMPAWQSAPSSAAQRAAVETLYETTGYRFRWPRLLRSAFKHPSYPYEDMPNYQRLEFLGDALLDMVIVDHLFQRFPDADPQWLTEHKMVMVSNHFYGFLAVQLGLQRHILVTTAAMVSQISDYVAEVEAEAEAEAAAAASASGAPREGLWLRTSMPPKWLSDILEALVGAMFVDSDYDYRVVQRFFAAVILPYFRDMTPYDMLTSNHPVTKLSHLLQEALACRDWRLCSTEVPCAVERGVTAMTDDDVICALMIHGQAVESATGRTVREAKALAAERALRLFEGLDAAGYRARMGCSCGEPEAEPGPGPETGPETEAEPEQDEAAPAAQG